MCAGSARAADEQAPRRGGTLRIGAWTEPVSLNPILSQSGLEQEMYRLMFLEPTFFDDKTRQTWPMLTEMPSLANGGISKDGKTWTFRIRPGLTWHDGKPVTSSDFAFAYERAVDPKVEYLAKSDLAIVEKVETPSPGTVVYRLKRRSGILHALLPPAIPEHVLAKSADFNRDPFNRKPVGNGPFEIVEWVSGSHVVFARRKDAPADGPPYLDRVIYKIIPDENARWVELRSGGIDHHRTSNLDVVEAARKSPGLSVVPLENPNWTHVGFNCASPIFSDRRVREAFARAIDKEGIAAKVSRQRPVPIYAMGARCNWFYTEDVEKYAYDPARAARLLDEAGWKTSPDGIRVRDGKRLRLRFATLSGSKPWQDLQVIFQDYAKKAGMELVLEAYPGSRFYASVSEGGILNTGEYDVSLLAWGPGHPGVFGKQIFHSGSIPPAGSNFYWYKNAEVDALLDRAEAELDEQERLRLDREAQRRIVADLPAWPLYVYQSWHIVSDRLRSYSPGPISTYVWNAKDWWLAK